MSLKIDSIKVEPGDHFFIKWRGSTEISIAISTWENGNIQVSGPFNNKQKRFMFSKDGVKLLESNHV